MEQPSRNVVMEMEMSVLSGLNMIEDESEYVFVEENEEMDFDVESYDHCDLSPDLSCAASVASGVTLNDLIQDVGSSMVSLEDDRNDGESKHADSMDVQNDESGDFAMNDFNPHNGRRLCNKKRRKKLKMLKKAAAAAHFESLRKAQSMPTDRVSVSERTAPERTSRSKPSSSVKSKKVHNLAVACAHESLAAFREEVVAGKQKKASIVNYVL
ncbi:hypothetical protein HJC23_010266 [Cyclotella cryptica]|uniref:Uncharacterized protein n=1 Tax=Cyclotella cryptica TaxID=29204 RepID=A0ABD3Q1F3_9STRA|eukprot:CCRYP_009887-RA/>CCRYP_009887-RA protein AED:0.24 eAED:0.24 QI:0/-1/0/1/-1/1/1/0/212